MLTPLYKVRIIEIEAINRADQSTLKYIFLTQIYFVYQKSLKQTFQTGFWLPNELNVWIHKVYIVIKKLVWNARNKPFWYTILHCLFTV